jgi:MarR family transcriptional regulator, transcriptional regulator for hemolysin
MADMIGKNKSTILRLINSLETKGLVRRVVDFKDRRKNYLMVTKKGEK